MPRSIRLLSEANVYHIVLKGNNSEQIFFDEWDYKNFMTVMKKSCDEYKASILAYCLMNNHAHLLIKFSENNMAQMFKSFGASFVFRYNKKYNRTGGIFNGRYYSKAINDDAYLLTVFKYIHFNPVKAYLCENPDDWKWSSYNEYNDKIIGYVTKNFINSILSDDEFNELHRKSDRDLIDFLSIDNGIRKLNDKELSSAIDKMKTIYSTDDIIFTLKKAGIPVYKLAKFLGISRDYAYKI